MNTKEIVTSALERFAHDHDLSDSEIAELEKIQDFGECLGSGIHRIVFRVGDLAVKVALNRSGRNANRTEANTWKEVVERGLERHFCPVLDISECGRVSIMKYAGKTLWDAHKDKPDVWGRCEERRLELRGLGVRVQDVHVGNLAHDGTVIDYGFEATFEDNAGFKSASSMSSYSPAQTYR